jgi:diguanylate cyclase (GGDEF)-like protein/PAS domain S-box-containing protein
MEENSLAVKAPPRQKTLLSSLLKMMFLVIIAITVFEYAKYLFFPRLTVFYSHIIGITFGVMVIAVTAYWVQKKQEKLLTETIAETDSRVQYEASLRNAVEKYHKLFIGSLDGVCQTAPDGKIVEVNQAFCDILGGDAEAIIGASINLFFDNPEDHILFRKVVEKNKGVKNYEVTQKKIDGQQIICSVSTSYCYSQAGEIDGYLTIVRDITEHKQAEQALETERKRLQQALTELTEAKKVMQESEERYRSLVELLPEAVVVHSYGRITYINKSGENIFGASDPGEIIGKPIKDFVHPDYWERVSERVQQVQEFKEIASLQEHVFNRLNGETFYVEARSVPIKFAGKIATLSIVRDISKRKRMEEEILSLSITDQLTGLHNRRGFLSLAEQQIKLSIRNKAGMLLFFADLDGLKWINDTLGHEEGDKALIEAATVLKETFRVSDIITRLGGDEYAALAVDITKDDYMVFTNRLQSLIDIRNNQGNRRYGLSISVGCSYYDPENPCSIEELMASADKLMYEQKQNKKSLLPQGASLSNSIH